MNSLVVSLLVFAAAATANPPVALYQTYHTIDSIPNSNYGFNYAVNDPMTGDNKAQWETRDGDVVKGAYSLVEPDGNVRVVEYSADPHSGFNAVVKRTGPNIHSIGLPIAAPVEPIVPVAEVAEIPLAPVAPIIHEAPVIHAAPLIHEHIVHEPIVTPIIEPAPLIAPLPLDLLHLPPLYLPPQAPWVSIRGTTYGKKGNIVRRWTAGPISLDGKTLTIKTKHH